MGGNSRMRHSARILMLRLVHRLSITHRRIVCRRKRSHRRSSGVCGCLFEGRPGHLRLHSQHLRGAITGCVVGAAGHHRGCGYGDAGIRQRNGRWSCHILLLDMVQTQVVGTHCGCIHGRVRVRSCMGGGPRIGELRVAVLHVAVVDVVKAHPAVLAVLVLNDHRHGE